MQGGANLPPPGIQRVKFWAGLEPGLSLPITLGESTATVTTDACDDGLGIWFDGHVAEVDILTAY